MNLNALSVAAKRVRLYGDITTKTASEYYLDFSGSEAITLHDNIQFIGNLKLWAEPTTTEPAASATIDSAENRSYSLSIMAGENEIKLSHIGMINALASFSLTGSSEVILPTDAAGNLTIRTSGSSGLSFLGNLSTVLTEDVTINTEESHGNINLSGLTFNGGYGLTLDSGAGNIHLGSVGIETPLASLHLRTQSNLHLYDTIHLADTSLDFSAVNRISLHNHLTLGSDSTPYAINFGNASIDGFYSLALYASDLAMNGTVGGNQALTNIDIHVTNNLLLGSDITLSGSMGIYAAGKIQQNSIIRSTGGDITIHAQDGLVMEKNTQTITHFGKVRIRADKEDISIGRIDAGQGIYIQANSGKILNAIDDYKSDKNVNTPFITQSSRREFMPHFGTLTASCHSVSRVVVQCYITQSSFRLFALPHSGC